jgi:hypothetical protein
VTRALIVGVLLVGLAVQAHAQAQPTAVEAFGRLQREADAAERSGDAQARLTAVLAMRELLHGAADATEASAEAYVAAGDVPHALAALGQFADMGQVDADVVGGTDRRFAVLHNRPEYRDIVARLAANAAPVSQGTTAFIVPDAGLLAEDIAYDPGSRAFLITSVGEKKIIRITSEGRATDFAASPSGWPMVAIKVDPVRGWVWATEVAFDGFFTVAKADWGRSAVLCFDLKTGALRRRIAAPVGAALGDMVLTGAGDPIVSDGTGGGVYRVVGDTLRLVNGRDFISPQTAAMVGDDAHVLVPDYARGIGVLDLRSGAVRWIAQGGGAPVALNGVDGLYVYRRSLMLTQNGTTPERVVRVELDTSLARVVSARTIEQGAATLGDPTHGVIVGDVFYYIANAGWNAIDEHGAVKPGVTQTAPRVMRVPL